MQKQAESRCFRSLIALIHLTTALALSVRECCATVFDYSVPFTSIEATVSTNGVSLSAFDPAQGRLIQTNVVTGTAIDLVVGEGIAVWKTGSGIFYFTYDPLRTNWMGGSDYILEYQITWGPKINKGMLAWIQDHSRVACNLYNRSLGLWTKTSTYPRDGLIGLTMADGLLLWIGNSWIGGITYDPALVGSYAGWQHFESSWSLGGVRTPFWNTNGVVAWENAQGTARLKESLTYDALRHQWARSSTYVESAFTLYSKDSVVTWAEGSDLNFQIYDPARGRWISTNVNNGSLPLWEITDATVIISYSGGGIPVAYGYNGALGIWQANQATQPLAAFSASQTNFNAPRTVYFGDMSAGAKTWQWDFDELGATSSLQSPTHHFTTLKKHNVSLRITSSSGQVSTTNIVVRTDASPPTGTILVNNGAAYSPNLSVTLTMDVADNSGQVVSNRFSNDGVTWSPWEPYTTTKQWSLSAGFGPKVVLGQFTDASDNIATLGKPILHFTNSPPVVSISSTSVVEATITMNLTVSLNETSQWPVGIRYAITNGTATPLTDYRNLIGVLTIPPGSLSQTLPVQIRQDAIVEPNETVLVTILSLTNGVAAGWGTLTILDDDSPPDFIATSIGPAASSFSAVITTAPGRRVTVETSSTLTNWTVLRTLTNTIGTISFTDTSTVPSRLFYRARLVP